MVGKSSSSAGGKRSRERVYPGKSGGSRREAAAVETGSKGGGERLGTNPGKEESDGRRGEMRAGSGNGLGTVLPQGHGHAGSHCQDAVGKN